MIASGTRFSIINLLTNTFCSFTTENSICDVVYLSGDRLVLRETFIKTIRKGRIATMSSAFVMTVWNIKTATKDLGVDCSNRLCVS